MVIIGMATNDYITGGSSGDSINGLEGNDTLEGGKGNDTLTGGDGDDVFVYTAGDGNDRITDYEEDDLIFIDGTVSKIAASGNNVILTVGSGKISLIGGADKIINYTDDDGAHVYPETAIYQPTYGITLPATYTDDTFDVADYGSKLQTIDASAVTHDLAITGNKLANKIIAGSGNDTLIGGKGSDSLTGGKGSDVFMYDDGDGNDRIQDYSEEDEIFIDGEVSSVSTTANGNVILTVGKGKISVVGAADKIISYTDDTGSHTCGREEVIENDKDNFSLYASDSDEVIENYGKDGLIEALGGNDTIFNDGANVTINGGTGDDRIDLAYAAKNTVIKYAAGDGNDFIDGFNEDDTLQIDGTWSTQQSGNRIIVTVGDGKITLRGAARLDTLNIVDANSSTLILTDDDTAKQTLAAGVEVADATARTKLTRIVGNDLDNSIIGGTGKDTIYAKGGDDFIDGGKGNDNLLGQDGNDTLAGGKGNDTLTGGKGSDVFYYTAGDGNDRITDYDEDDLIQVSGTVNRISQTQAGTVILWVGSSKISVEGGSEHVITYSDDTGTYTYPEVDTGVKFNDAGTAATLTAAYTAETFDAADYTGTLKTIDASAVESDIAITGNKLANRIIAGEGNDTLIGGKGNDTLIGGDGDDVFVYNTGDGNDLIVDYEEDDIIQINGAVSKIAQTSAGTVILWVGSQKISVVGGSNKIITYVDDDGTRVYPSCPYTGGINEAGTSVTLGSNYIADTFDVNTSVYVSDYAGTLKTIDASAVEHDIAITGNKLANRIIAGEGNDTLAGGKGHDSLTGGDGDDVFYYTTGDGNDIITDYDEDDTIVVIGTVASVAASGDDVVFTVGSGKVTVKDAKDKVIAYSDETGDHSYPPTVEFSADGKYATLMAAYYKDTFDVADYPDYAGTVLTINATKVQHDIAITANANANTIIGSSNDDSINGGAGKDLIYGSEGNDTLNGSEGNDTLNGGKGNDTLYGSEGNDTFLYNAGDGNDVIEDYEESDVIRITGVTGVSVSNSGDDVIMRVGTNTITIKDAAEDDNEFTPITYYDVNRRHSYIPALDGSNDLLADDNYSTDAAQVADIAEPFKASYTPYDFEAGFDLVKQTNFTPAITFTDKK